MNKPKILLTMTDVGHHVFTFDREALKGLFNSRHVMGAVPSVIDEVIVNLHPATFTAKTRFKINGYIIANKGVFDDIDKVRNDCETFSKDNAWKNPGYRSIFLNALGVIVE